MRKILGDFSTVELEIMAIKYGLELFGSTCTVYSDCTGAIMKMCGHNIKHVRGKYNLAHPYTQVHNLCGRVIKQSKPATKEKVQMFKKKFARFMATHPEVKELFLRQEIDSFNLKHGGLVQR